MRLALAQDYTLWLSVVAVMTHSVPKSINNTWKWQSMTITVLINLLNVWSVKSLKMVKSVDQRFSKWCPQSFISWRNKETRNTHIYEAKIRVFLLNSNQIIIYQSSCQLIDESLQLYFLALLKTWIRSTSSKTFYYYIY